MPKALQYKTNSIIYFKGDKTDRFFVLKSGKIGLSPSASDEAASADHSKIQEVKPGEFFGMRASLGAYPQDETALALEPSEVIALAGDEFERLVTQNSSIVLKLLKNFSVQLTAAHKEAEELLKKQKSVEQADAEEGFFNVGLYFLKGRMYKQSVDAFNRYLKQYPNGRFSGEARAHIETARAKEGSAEDRSGQMLPSGPSAASPAFNQSVSEAEQQFNEAKTLFDQKKYAQAFLKFNRIAREADEPDYAAFLQRTEYYLGETLYNLQKYEDTVGHFMMFMQKYPEDEHMQRVMYIMAKSYEAQGDKPRAKIFYEKLRDLLGPEAPLRVQVEAALRGLD